MLIGVRTCRFISAVSFCYCHQILQANFRCYTTHPHGPPPTRKAVLDEYPDFSFQTESTFYFHTGEQETDFKWMLDHLVLKYKVKSFWKFGVNDKWFKQDERTYVKFTFNEATFLPTSK